ncbi:kinase-like protein [Gigaspora margarita]|nr:kinase-like protein [Gigaspora margarita]
MLIADFGVSKHIDEVTTVKADGIGIMLGYLEPKCFVDPQYKCDKRSDIYSLGVILWEITSGRPPFDSYENKIAIVTQVNNGVRETPVKDTPETFVNLYKRCWDKDPGKRPDIMTVLENLESIQSSNDIKVIRSLKRKLTNGRFIQSIRNLFADDNGKSSEVYNENFQLNKEVSQSNEEISQSNEERSQSNEETSQSNEERSQSNEETSQSNEEASQSNEETFQSNEEISQPNEEIFQPNEETFQLNEKISQSNEETSQSNEKIFQLNEKISQPNEETSQSQSNEETSQLSEEASQKSNEEGSQSNEELFQLNESNYEKAINESKEFHIEDYEIFRYERII